MVYFTLTVLILSPKGYIFIKCSKLQEKQWIIFQKV